MNIFTESDSYLFHEGTNYELYKKLGAHPDTQDGVEGTRFALWAPHAQYVSLICARTGWENENWMFRSEKDQGIWECFLPGVFDGDAYRFIITGADGVRRWKSDPMAFRAEPRPANASIGTSLDTYTWGDEDYQATRDNTHVVEKPMAIYEVHLGSWKKGYRDENDQDGFLNYRQLGDDLAEYVKYMGYTHVELMGICEYPFDLSWGYQVTGYFAPTSRYGTPDDFRYLVDKLHQNGIGVILDWVPAHFPKDDFAMGYFDGTHLYESEDPLRAEYPEWGTYAFDHSKPEVRSFLISSAFYWINEFHIDALRVDAVAAMIYANYSRAEWRPNRFGGYLNLEGMDFLRQLNYEVCGKTTGYLIAEDSSQEWGITEDVTIGGLGFTFKWNMGWMNDTLKYFALNPIYRQWHHGELTHTVDYAFSENFVLVLSHDEVVYGKHSMLEKSPGGIEERYGAVKALYALQFTHPGKKLLFMGQDFAQHSEWNVQQSIDWHLADELGHRDVMLTIQKLLDIYKKNPVLYADSKNSTTFEWVNRNDTWGNTLSFIRRNPWDYNEALLVICSFSPTEHNGYVVGAPIPGKYERIFSTYDALTGEANSEPIYVDAVEEECDGRPYRLYYSLRPYEAVIFRLPKVEAPKKPVKKASKKPAAKKPASAAKKTADKKPAAKKTETAKKAADKKPAVKKTTAAKKPAAKKPAKKTEE